MADTCVCHSARTALSEGEVPLLGRPDAGTRERPLLPDRGSESGPAAPAVAVVTFGLVAGNQSYRKRIRLVITRDRRWRGAEEEKQENGRIVVKRYKLAVIR